MASFFKQLSASIPRSVSPITVSPLSSVSPQSSATSNDSGFKPTDSKERLQAQGMAVGIMRKSGVPPEYRAEMLNMLIDSILYGRKQKYHNTDEQLYNELAGHTCVKDWVRKAFAQYEMDTRAVDEETKQIKRNSLIHGIAILLGEGFNIVQEPNPAKKQFFERDSAGKIVGILDTKQGQPNARFSECDKAIRQGDKLLLGGKRRKPRKQHRKGSKLSRRRKLH